MRALIAVDAPHGDRLAAELSREGMETAVVDAAAPGRSIEASRFSDRAVDPLLADVQALVLAVSRDTLTAGVLAACDRLGIRIVPLATESGSASLAAAAGLGESLPLDAPGWRVADAITRSASRSAPAGHRPVEPAGAEPPHPRGGIIAVWGPAGAPGRSTVAVALSAELARGGRAVGLIDADTHAPSLALALGLADEGPGFAAACRQAERAGLDAAELTRISAPLPLADGAVSVLTGINRPSRWPELTGPRVAAALDVCRDWADHIVVDVAASLEQDDEIVSDLDGLRRNSATLAVLRAADLVVGVLSADPLGASRFVRGYDELRAVVGTTPVAVVANRLRPGALGIDPRGQVRRTLDRFAGIPDVAFLPLDPRSADAAMLSARPMSDAAPRSPFTLAVRRFVGDTVLPSVEPSRPRRTA